jgi:exo-beta-1,3-glucanase (GH17 family)
MRFLLCVIVLMLAPIAPVLGQEADKRFPLFAYLTGEPTPLMMTYTPSQLDPRQEVNQRLLKTSSIRADLVALRPTFDGLILYGYHEACTPRILAVAKDLKFRAVILAIWDPKSAAETDGVAALAKMHENDFALGILLGNEGITFKRYEFEDVTIAADRLRKKLPKTIPLSTSEPLVGYKSEAMVGFGDFLAPNIHPVFDRPALDAESAAAWARKETLALATRAKRPVLLKETGFPHAGKAGYSPASQRTFWQAYLKPGLIARPADLPSAWAFHGIAFDAFDLPWKSIDSKLEIERSWGLFSNKREPYPALEPWKARRDAKEKPSTRSNFDAAPSFTSVNVTDKKLKEPEPTFEFKFRKPADGITVAKEAKRTLLVVNSPSGIGDSTITLKAGQWPENVTLRFQHGKDKGFTSLEEFRLTTERVQIEGSKALSGKFRFAFLDAKRTPVAIEPGKREAAGVLDVPVTVHDGAIEVALPTCLFVGSREIRLAWIDAFR